MKIDQMWQRDDNWVGTEIDDSYVMINIHTGKYVALNASASHVWDVLGTPKTVQDILIEMRREFFVDESTCSQSIEKLLTQMQSLEIASPC